MIKTENFMDRDEIAMNSSPNTVVLPFLKWAGGKRWLTHHRDLGIFPDKYETYIEPFVGSGAIFFHLRPQKAILSDINKLLIDTYQAIKDDWRLVRKYLKQHHEKHSKRYYYKMREAKLLSRYQKAARFIYLNRTCWNGLYRVNTDGKFNVPIGTKSNVILDSDDFFSVSWLYIFLS